MDFSLLKDGLFQKKMRSGQVYQTVIDVKNLEPDTKLVTMNIEFASPFNEEVERDGLVSILPELVNVTAPVDDFSMRYYYKDRFESRPFDEKSTLQHCGDKAGCSKISLRYKIGFNDEANQPFSNQFIFLVKDKRIYLGKN